MLQMQGQHSHYVSPQQNTQGQTHCEGNIKQKIEFLLKTIAGGSELYEGEMFKIFPRFAECTCSEVKLQLHYE